MKKLSLSVILMVYGMIFVQRALAVDWYVATNGTGQGTGGEWANATNNLQGAIDACVVGSTVWVSNGVYQTGAMLYAPDTSVTSNRIVIWKAITVRSKDNDPTNTIIMGGGVETESNAVRCVAMTNGAVLIGVTLSGGRCRGASTIGNGGGVWSTSTDTVISNCVMNDCKASSRTGVPLCYGFGGGAYRGTLYDCVLTNGYGLYSGGAEQSVLYNCTIIKNKGLNGGGGLRRCTAYNCRIEGNWGGTIGGGGAVDSTLYNCRVINNFSAYGGGARFGQVYSGGGFYNCTVVSNSSSVSGGGMSIGAKYNDATVYNSIIYSNKAPVSANWEEGMGANNSCTFPEIPGTSNITNNPSFVNHAAGNYRLNANSPCINTGTNGSWTASGGDLDGVRRISGGIVDMGCYEYIFRGTLLFVW